MGSDTSTGTATSWDPSPNSTVNTITPTLTAIYVAGDFTTLGGVARSYAGAVDPLTGAVLGNRASRAISAR
ncbi:MAG: hypothetical protein WCO82_10985, partial [Sphingomonadales bacterium]